MNNLNQTMTPEKQRIAIAKACGISPLWSTALPMRAIHCNVPDYLNDLNAMHTAEDWLLSKKEASEEVYLRHLQCMFRYCGEYRATAAQRAEALLRTLGKWEE
jgi:hypothetical protein